MKVVFYMITGYLSDFGSWKCGKAGGFTHMPTNFMILIKMNSPLNYKGK